MISRPFIQIAFTGGSSWRKSQQFQRFSNQIQRSDDNDKFVLRRHRERILQALALQDLSAAICLQAHIPELMWRSAPLAWNRHQQHLRRIGAKDFTNSGPVL